MPAGFYEDFAGQSRLEINEGNSTLIAFGLAIIIIYLVLAAQFESFRDPLIIMLTVPLSIFGALVPLNIGLATLNIYTQVGLITLIGLITKHGILMVQFANQQREAGMPKLDAIVEAARVRLRPILMTTAAMVLGVVPLIIASGAGAKARFSIGLVIAAGMAIGTLFTLFVLPMFYTFIARSDEAMARERAGARPRRSRTRRRSRLARLSQPALASRLTPREEAAPARFPGAAACAPPLRQDPAPRSPRRSPRARQSYDGRRADAGPRRGDAPTRPPGAPRSACRRARGAARCALPPAIARCSRLSQFSYCRQVSALRAPATQSFISSMSSEVACSAASRASSGSTASRARMTSAGLVAAAIAATDEISATGRAPMKVPFPTCRQSSPCRSMIGQRLAKVAARDAEKLGELALRRQPRRRRQRPLGEPGAKLRERALPAVAIRARLPARLALARTSLLASHQSHPRP